MINLTKLLKSLPEMDCVASKEELVSFASNLAHLKQGLLEDEEESNETNESNVNDVDSEVFKGHVVEKSVKKIAFKSCLSCTFKLLMKTLYTVYKFLITLSTTQCTC